MRHVCASIIAWVIHPWLLGIVGLFLGLLAMCIIWCKKFKEFCIVKNLPRLVRISPECHLPCPYLCVYFQHVCLVLYHHLPYILIVYHCTPMVHHACACLQAELFVGDVSLGHRNASTGKEGAISGNWSQVGADFSLTKILWIYQNSLNIWHQILHIVIRESD